MNDFSVDERKVIIFVVSILAFGLGVWHVRTKLPQTAELFASIAPAEFLTEDTPVCAQRRTPSAPVAVNSADIRQLQSLPGIGPAIAGRIIAYREQNGRFKGREDLLKVKGIGPKKLQKIQDAICFE